MGCKIARLKTWGAKSYNWQKIGVKSAIKIGNNNIRERVRATPIVEKMVENRLRWFMACREKKDLEINELDRNMVYDNILWRNPLHVSNPI
ncbi:hypothetical protein MTR_4g122880 [Medicago truncatula]|uniref:Uncharacterized protein n=1 Tax=Medicago truncatula TaxID=3880 RepID=G7JPZ2_MEDTR|nr:hypothetical protein MTR_4g122880 [Medicago truncatula]